MHYFRILEFLRLVLRSLLGSIFGGSLQCITLPNINIPRGHFRCVDHFQSIIHLPKLHVFHLQQQRQVRVAPTGSCISLSAISSRVASTAASRVSSGGFYAPYSRISCKVFLEFLEHAHSPSEGLISGI